MPDALWEIVLVVAVVVSWAWMYRHDKKVEDKLGNMSKVLNVTHDLVNEKLGIVLREYADLLKRTAASTGESEDVRRAAVAQSRADHHDAQQAESDANKAKEEAAAKKCSFFK